MNSKKNIFVENIPFTIRNNLVQRDVMCTIRIWIGDEVLKALKDHPEDLVNVFDEMLVAKQPNKDTCVMTIHSTHFKKSDRLQFSFFLRMIKKFSLEILFSKNPNASAKSINSLGLYPELDKEVMRATREQVNFYRIRWY